MNALLSEIFLSLVRAACELRLMSYSPKHIMVVFLYTILCITTCTTRKLMVVQGHFTYQTIAVQSEISILFVRAVCKIWSASYKYKHASQPLPDTAFCGYLTLVTQKLQFVCGRSTYQMTALLSEMYIFCVRAGCETWMVSYASKHAS